MAVRFSADGQDYTRSLALGAQTAHTVCGWFKISTDRNDYSTLWSLDNGTGDMELIQTDSDGTTLGAYLDYDAGNIVAMTAGVWYFVAVVAATTGNTRTAYYKVEGANALTSVSLGTGSSTNVATLRIGESPFGAEYLNGCAAAVKMWSGQSLTQAELELESNQYQPVRTANLTFYYPFVNAGTTDYSGNAQTLSGGSGTATEAGPSIRWDRRAVPKLFLPPPAGGPGSITGVAAAPLGGLAATATGTKNVGGTASAPLGTLSASASGTPKVTGTAAAPLGALTASATGTPKVLATAAALSRFDCGCFGDRHGPRDCFCASRGASSRRYGGCRSLRYGRSAIRRAGRDSHRHSGNQRLRRCGSRSSYGYGHGYSVLYWHGRRRARLAYCHGHRNPVVQRVCRCIAGQPYRQCFWRR
jgi:hypothetical protein